jgi:ABC-type transport system involved in multi-copper enzyme maturation permease subunit
MYTVSIVMIGKEKKFTCAGDEANGDGALWTMPLILPLVFFFSNSLYSVAFFFCSGLSSLSTGFGPLFFFFFVCVCSLVFLF